MHRAGADRCPGALATHEAEDGRLARIRIPGGMLSPDQLEAVAGLADDGNGIVEITARGNLQVRGLGAEPAAGRALRLDAVGLLPSPEHERVRNILASPFGGRHCSSLVSTDDLVVALDRGICSDPAFGRLSGRFLFAVDDGSGVMAGQRADVGLMAEPSGTGRARFRLFLDGRPTTRYIGTAIAVDAALAAARAFLDLSSLRGGRAWRVGDLASGAERLAERLGTRLGPAPPDSAGLVVRAGLSTQRNGYLAISGLAPLGRLSPQGLRAIASAARPLGAGVRTSPWRTLTLLDVPPGSARSAQSALEAAGLLVEGDDGWHRLSACAGLGACAKASADVRTAAVRRARQRGPGSPREHWSGCERRCGESASVGVSAVAVGGRVVVSRLGARYEVADVDEAVALLGGSSAS